MEENTHKPKENLSKKVFKGSFWVFGTKTVQRLFSLTRLIILARILSPNDFGLMGIALLTMATLNTFTQTGFQAALIQKKEEIRSYLDSAWTILIIRGFILFTILFFSAPYAAIFFKAPEAAPIIRVISFCVLFQAFTNIGIIYFNKELDFGKQFVYRFSVVLTDFIVAITSVLILRNVWALVFGLLAGNLVGCIMSYYIHPYRPHLSKDLMKAKELWEFGKWVFGSSVLIFLLMQGDDAFVGKFLGIAMLGFYQMAYKISNMPATEITHVISQVTFPAYSKLQDDLPRLKNAFLKVLQITSLLSFPVAGLILIFAPDFTKLFLGQKWMPMVPAMEILSIFGITRALNATMGPIFNSIGKPKLLTSLSGIQLIIMAVIIYPLSAAWGLVGTSLAVIFPNFFILILITVKTKHILDFSYKDFFDKIAAPAIAVFITFLFIPLRNKLMSYTTNIYNFTLSVILIVFLYLMIIYFWDKKSGNRTFKMIFETFANFKEG